MTVRVIAKMWDRQFTGGIVEVDLTHRADGIDLQIVGNCHALLFELEREYRENLVDIRIESSIPVQLYEY